MDLLATSGLLIKCGNPKRFALHSVLFHSLVLVYSRRVPILHRSFPDVRLLQIRQLSNDHGIFQLLPVFDLCE